MRAVIGRTQPLRQFLMDATAAHQIGKLRADQCYGPRVDMRVRRAGKGHHQTTDAARRPVKDLVLPEFWISDLIIEPRSF